MVKTMYKASVSRYQGQALGLAAGLLAVGGVLGSANIASAATFGFSFSNVQGAVSGTVSGTIVLPDGDGTFAATSLTVTSAPSGLGYTLPLDILASVSTSPINSFTVVGGQIGLTGTQFSAFLTGGGVFSLNALGSKLNLATGGFSDNGVLDQNNSTLGFAAVPEPGSAIALLTIGALGAISRKRKA